MAASFPKLKITYFPIQGPAEAARLALTIGGIPFEDERVPGQVWKGDDGAALKARSPWGQLPLLNVDGAVFGQSAAIAAYCGQLAGLVPSDPLVALQMNAVCQFVNQDVRDRLISPTMKFNDDEADKKAAARKDLSDVQLPEKMALLETFVDPASGFLAGPALTMADVQFYTLANWLGSGALDGVSSACITAQPGLTKLLRTIDAMPAVAKWNAEKNAGKVPWLPAA